MDVLSCSFISSILTRNTLQRKTVWQLPVLSKWEYKQYQILSCLSKPQNLCMYFMALSPKGDTVLKCSSLQSEHCLSRKKRYYILCLIQQKSSTTFKCLRQVENYYYWDKGTSLQAGHRTVVNCWDSERLRSPHNPRN